MDNGEDAIEEEDTAEWQGEGSFDLKKYLDDSISFAKILDNLNKL